MSTSTLKGPQPQVFARQATGLRKEAGAFDIFVYNTNNANIGLGVAFLVLALGSYVGAGFALSAVLASVLVVPLYFVYSRLAADMPRSGGDYVWVSRIFGPAVGSAVGFVVAWTWIVLAATAIGAPMAYLTQLGVTGLTRSLGAATGSTELVTIGNWASGKTGTMVIGTVFLLLFTAIMIGGVGLYMRIQRYAFFAAIIGVVVALFVGFLGSRSSFAGDFDHYISSVGGKGAGAYAKVTAAGPAQPSGISFKPTAYAMLWTLYMVLFGATSCYIGGEVRQPARSQRLGMFGSLALTGGAITLLLLALEHLMGIRFLQGLATFDPTKLGIHFTPTYNELITAALPSSVLWAIVVGGSFLFWTYVWMPINYFTATRLMLALSVDGYLPRSVSKVHPRFATPYVAIGVTAVLGEISLVLYVVGVLSIITLVWAGILMFFIAGIAAVLYPYRMPESWKSGGATRVAGVPTISIWGGLLVISMLAVLYIFWFDPSVGIGNTTKQTLLNLGLPVTGLIAFLVIWAVRRRGGVDVRLSSAEIPPV